MPGDGAMIKRGKNPCCHGDYVGGKAEIVQIVMKCGVLKLDGESASRRRARSTVLYECCRLWLSRAMGTEPRPLDLATWW